MKKLSRSENEENDKIKTGRMQVNGEGEEGVWKSVEAVDEEGGWRLRSLSRAVSCSTFSRTGDKCGPQVTQRLITLCTGKLTIQKIKDPEENKLPRQLRKKTIKRRDLPNICR